MSRSRKRFPVWKLKNDRDMKRFANKAARHADLMSGRHFAKVFPSWKICDFSCFETDGSKIDKAKRK